MEYRKLIENLSYELDELAQKSSINSVDLDKIQKLTSAIKNIKAIEGMEGYSYEGNYNSNNNSNYNSNNSYNDDYSYRRRRDSMGRYSRHDEGKGKIVERIHRMINDGRFNEEDREALRSIVQELDR